MESFSRIVLVERNGNGNERLCRDVTGFTSEGHAENFSFSKMFSKV